MWRMVICGLTVSSISCLPLTREMSKQSFDRGREKAGGMNCFPSIVKLKYCNGTLITDSKCCLQFVFLLSLRQKSKIFDCVSAAASVGASAARQVSTGHPHPRQEEPRRLIVTAA